MSFEVVPAGPSHGPGLLALFQRTGSPCHCRWWHFDGDKNAWLDRCANRASESRAELAARVAEGHAEARGVVAVDADQAVVGWMKVCEALTVPKLFEQRLYKGLACFDGDRSSTWVIGCFLIDEPWRRRGVARALLAGGIELARNSGATHVEAFPRRAEDVPAEQLWTGPSAIFDALGFTTVHDFAPYPVLRLTLRSGSAG
ncbi:MAG: GNAT family N-acetyltransferase [Polyangiaceae bacterium]